VTTLLACGGRASTRYVQQQDNEKNWSRIDKDIAKIILAQLFRVQCGVN